MMYHQAVDHQANDVYYIGEAEKLENIPDGLRCTKIARPGSGPIHREVIETVERLKLKLDHVVSLSEFELTDAARVREHFGVQGLSVAEVERFRDKTVMKKHVRDAGIAAPGFGKISQWLDGAVNFRQREVIVKPLDGASSVDVVRFANQDALRAALENQTTGIEDLDREAPRYDAFEVEDFVAGDILHFDGIVQDGGLKLLLCGRYYNTLLEFAGGKPSGSIQEDVSPAMEIWVREVLKALAIERGVFHLEAIEHIEDGLVFLEIGLRTGGARIGETFQLQTGIHLPTVEMSLAVHGRAEVSPRLDEEHKYGWFLVPGHHHDRPYYQIRGHEFLYDLPEVLALEQFPYDQELIKHVTYVKGELPLTGLLKASRGERLVELLGRLFEQVEVTAHDQPWVDTSTRSRPARVG